MGKKLLRTLLFFAVFAILFACISHVVAPKDTTKEAGMHEPHAKAFLAEPEDTLDVLFLGNSEVYRGVAPLTIWEEQGITAYNCGTNDQILFQTEFYLSRFLECQSPKIVFLDTDILYRNYSTLEALSYRVEEWFPLIRYHDRWKNLQFSDFTDPIRFETPAPGKGYEYIGYHVPVDDAGHMTPSDVVEAFPSKNLRHVQNLQKLCREHGAELILFSTPSTMNWNYPRHNAAVQLSQQLGMEYLDLNLLREEIPIDWQVDAMDDGNHVNYKGARKVSSYLGKYLAERDLFADKRSLPEFASWNAAMAEFYTQNQIEPRP